eukprot:4442369-Ditylum_brightwellii.AAC.1
MCFSVSPPFVPITTSKGQCSWSVPISYFNVVSLALRGATGAARPTIKIWKPHGARQQRCHS